MNELFIIYMVVGWVLIVLTMPLIEAKMEHRVGITLASVLGFAIIGLIPIAREVILAKLVFDWASKIDSDGHIYLWRFKK